MLLRPNLTVNTITSTELTQLKHKASVKVGGLVIARQRPSTANGIVFLLLEDEFGTINLVIPSPVYEKNRLTIRTESLVIAQGYLERGGTTRNSPEVVNLRVTKIHPINQADEAKVIELKNRKEDSTQTPNQDLAEFYSVLPAVQSFGARRR
jgi:error-prone DNA polymerase